MDQLARRLIERYTAEVSDFIKALVIHGRGKIVHEDYPDPKIAVGSK